MEDKQANIQRLKTLVQRAAPEPGKNPTAIAGVYCYRIPRAARIDCIAESAVGVIVQGNKRAVVADEEYRFGAGQYIAYGMGLPATSHIIGASEETLHLALVIALDRALLCELVCELAAEPGQGSGGRVYKGITVGALSAELLDAYVRLVRLLDAPKRIGVLAPMIIREIHYYLLTGPEGKDFRLLGSAAHPHNQIARALDWLRSHYREPFSLAELAGRFDMSTTSFCRHFSRITGLSPLRFQKRLRLYEAQRLMLSGGTSAEAESYEVGYESPAQFNREYKRQFGEPPHRDRERLLALGAITGEKRRGGGVNENFYHPHAVSYVSPQETKAGSYSNFDTASSMVCTNSSCFVLLLSYIKSFNALLGIFS
jgi:AraC-like DNA-binding protein